MQLHLVLLAEVKWRNITFKKRLKSPTLKQLACLPEFSLKSVVLSAIFYHCSNKERWTCPLTILPQNSPIIAFLKWRTRKLNLISQKGWSQLKLRGLATKVKTRIHSVDTFVHVLYKLGHSEEIIPCTKTLYNCIHQGLLDIKPIDLPKLVCIRKRTKKRLETSVEK